LHFNRTNIKFCCSGGLCRSSHHGELHFNRTNIKFCCSGGLCRSSHQENCISTELILNFVVQVDYIVPVITENYLNAICGRSSVSESSMLCTDTHYQYIKYIYDLMATYYIRNGCINDKIRCVIPDDLVHLTRRQVMARPLFQVWVRASEVEQLSQRMLGSRF
jgi:hypothetical protein